jgi:hypothetical protein
MRLTVLLLSGLVLAGCVNELAQRQAFLNQFVGRPDQALVQQLGVPNRSYETGGVKYLAYDESRVDILPPPPGWGPWWYYGGGFAPQVVNLVCSTTFAVANGVVTSYTLRGNACG